MDIIASILQMGKLRSRMKDLLVVTQPVRGRDDIQR